MRELTAFKRMIGKLTDEEFFGVKDIDEGIYKFIIKQRQDRLHKSYIRERASR
jgi:hypothetical protein